MKLNINRKAILDALTILNAVIPSRTPKPVLKGVLMYTASDGFHVYGTDLEMAVDHRVDAVDVLAQGRAVIDAERLNAIVKESQDQTIQFEVESNRCIITGTDSRYTVYTYQVDDYPSVGVFERPKGLELDLTELQKACRQVVFAAARESSRYAINGVLWELKGKKLVLVATDGRRLARRRISVNSVSDSSVWQQRVIVPTKAMSLVERLAGDDGLVCVGLEGNQIVFASGPVVIFSTLVDGTFPKYEDIIPTDYKKRLTLNTELFASAVRRAALLSTEQSKGIKITLQNNRMVLASKVPETGEAEVTLTVDYTGDPLCIGFNPQYLLEPLRVLEGENLDIELDEQDRPALLRAESDFLYVVMPINLG